MDKTAKKRLQTAGIILTLIILGTFTILLGCGEEAGEAYSKLTRKSSTTAPTKTVTKSSSPISSTTCSYREGEPMCDGDVRKINVQLTSCESIIREQDCSTTAQICSEGECRPPCSTVRGRAFCVGNQLKRIDTDRRCTDTVVLIEDCSATGKVCDGMACRETTPEVPATPCTSGDDCSTGICIAGTCREDCGYPYNGAMCSDDSTPYTAAGICAWDAHAMENICDRDEVAFIDGGYLSDCFGATWLIQCDSDASGGYATTGICAYTGGFTADAGVDTYNCITGPATTYEAPFPEGPVTMYTNNCLYYSGNPCDSDVSDGTYSPDGVCGRTGCLSS